MKPGGSPLVGQDADVDPDLFVQTLAMVESATDPTDFFGVIVVGDRDEDKPVFNVPFSAAQARWLAGAFFEMALVLERKKGALS